MSGKFALEAYKKERVLRSGVAGGSRTHNFEACSDLLFSGITVALKDYCKDWKANRSKIQRRKIHCSAHASSAINLTHIDVQTNPLTISADERTTRVSHRTAGDRTPFWGSDQVWRHPHYRRNGTQRSL